MTATTTPRSDQARVHPLLIGLRRSWLVVKAILFLPLLVWMLVMGAFFGLWLVFIIGLFGAALIGTPLEGLANLALPSDLESSGAIRVTVGIAVGATAAILYFRSVWEEHRSGRGNPLLLDALGSASAFVREWRRAPQRRDHRPRTSMAKVPVGTAKAEEPDLAVAHSEEALIGWRIWRVGPRRLPLDDEVGDPMLWSVAVGLAWPDPEIVATCFLALASFDHEHRVPTLNCRCGVYALKDPQLVPAYARGVWAASSVEMSGRVFEGERGYRAERARIRGPLSIYYRCYGDPRIQWGEGCDHPVVTVVPSQHGYLALCERHLKKVPTRAPRRRRRSRPLFGTPISLEDFALKVGSRLELRYGVNVDMRGES